MGKLRTAIVFVGGILVGGIFTIVGSKAARRGEREDEGDGEELLRRARRLAERGRAGREPEPLRVVVVEAGDNPHKIARRILGAGYVARQWWRELREVNPGKPLSAPDRWVSLEPGESLFIPAEWWDVR